MSREQTPLLSVGNRELPAYRAIEIREDKERKHSLYESVYLNDDKIITIPLSKLQQLNQSLQQCLSPHLSCKEKCQDSLIDFFSEYWLLLLLLAAAALTVGTGYGLIRYIIKTSKASFEYWDRLSFSIYKNMTCPAAYNEVARCHLISRGEDGQLILKGISEKNDSICYNALYNLCVDSCGLYLLSSEIAPRDCKGSVIGQEVTMGILSPFIALTYFGILIFLFLWIDQRFPNCGDKTPQRRFSRFLTNRPQILQETKIVPYSKKNLEDMKQEVENRMNWASFFEERQQCVAETLPVSRKNPVSKRNSYDLAMIVDEYLGVQLS